MFEKMKIAMPSINIQKLGDLFKFAEVITATIRNSILNSIHPNSVVPIEGEGLTTKATYWSVILPKFPKKPDDINE